MLQITGVTFEDPDTLYSVEFKYEKGKLLIHVTDMTDFTACKLQLNKDQIQSLLNFLFQLPINVDCNKYTIN